MLYYDFEKVPVAYRTKKTNLKQAVEFQGIEEKPSFTFGSQMGVVIEVYLRKPEDGTVPELVGRANYLVLCKGAGTALPPMTVKTLPSLLRLLNQLLPLVGAASGDQGDYATILHQMCGE
jgi:hypothetical protein